jgi:hypothetical protein
VPCGRLARWCNAFGAACVSRRRCLRRLSVGTLTIVFTALAVAHCIQQRTGLAISNAFKQLRPLRTSAIVINGVTETFPPEIPSTQRDILTRLGITPGY